MTDADLEEVKYRTLGNGIVLERNSTNSVTCRNRRQFIWAEDTGLSSNSYDYNHGWIPDHLTGSVKFLSTRAVNETLLGLKYELDENQITITKQSPSRGEILVAQTVVSGDESIHMDASTDVVIVANGFDKRLAFYEYSGDCVFDCVLEELSTISGLHILPDKCVVVSDNHSSTVTKLSIDLESITIETVWTCEDVYRPTGMSSDDNGIIYVGSEEGTVHILSPQGVLLLYTLIIIHVA